MCSLASCHIILYRAEKPEGSDVFHLSVRLRCRRTRLFALSRALLASVWPEQNLSSTFEANTRSDLDGGAQAQILRLGLRGSGTKCRPAEAARRADGNAVRTRRPRAYAAAERGRTPFARTADQAARFARADLLEQHVRSRRPYVWARLSRYRTRFLPPLSESMGRRRLSARRARPDSHPRMVRRRQGGSVAIRRRFERGRRRRAAGRRRLPRRRLDRPRESQQGDRNRPCFARGPNPGGRTRSRARRPVAPARLHAAPFPAILRVLVARRVGGDALGRPFRDALHAYRRIRRVTSRRDANRNRRVAAAPRLRRGTEPGSDVHRLGRRVGNYHGGVDAPSGPSQVPRRRINLVPRLRHRGKGRPRNRAGRPLPGELPPARPW